MATIDDLVTLARAEGLSGTPADWSNARVWWFEELMPDSVRKAGEASPNLDPVLTECTPHERAGDGFIDTAAALAITFPRQS